MSFAEKLRAVRIRHALTQRELAALLDLRDRSHIAHLEHPRPIDTPSLELAFAVAQRFDVALDYLLDDRVPVEPMPESCITQRALTKLPRQQLGATIRTLRQAHGWSPTELGRKLTPTPSATGYTRSHISNLEAGRRLPSIELLVRLAALFDTTADALLHDAASAA